MVNLYFDTDMDVSPEFAAKYGAKLISMPYIVDDKVFYPYQDDVGFDAHTFYQKLRNGTLPSTAALNTEDYKKIFEPEFKAGNDVLYVHFSAAMTCSFDNLAIALEELKAQYPHSKTKFYEVDTKGVSASAYYQAIMAGEMFLAKKTPEEIVDAITRERDHVACYFYADNLNFFRRSGRVNNLSAFLGNILGIHPIITIDDRGKMDTCTKVRGANQVLRAIVKYVETLGDNIKDHPVIIPHADCLSIAERLGAMLKETFGADLQLQYLDVNPTIGSHCGPDTVGVCFHATQR